VTAVADPGAGERKSGTPGIAWDREKGKWRVTVSLMGKRRHAGFFAELPDAEAAAAALRSELSGAGGAGAVELDDGAVVELDVPAMCSVAGCGRVAETRRGYCGNCYGKWRRCGDPRGARKLAKDIRAGVEEPLGSGFDGFDVDFGELSEDDPGDWRSEALCAQADPDAWFPEKGGSTRMAKRICLGCPVKQQCLEYALIHDQRWGVWGGLSERERRCIRRGPSGLPAV